MPCLWLDIADLDGLKGSIVADGRVFCIHNQINPAVCAFRDFQFACSVFDRNRLQAGIFQCGIQFCLVGYGLRCRYISAAWAWPRACAAPAWTAAPARAACGWRRRLHCCTSFYGYFGLWLVSFCHCDLLCCVVLYRNGCRFVRYFYGTFFCTCAKVDRSICRCLDNHRYNRRYCSVCCCRCDGYWYFCLCRS